MRINNNLMAMNTHRQLGINSEAGSKSIEKLSSGLRINRAGDDAAGLAISEKMRSQIRGLGQASRNAQDGISMIQTAEGALNESHAILQRMRELAVQSATDTNTADDRTKLQSEVDQLAKELTRISNTTEFNTKNLLAGGLTSTFHVGANADQNVALSITGMDAKTLGVTRDIATATLSGNVDVTAATMSGTLGSGIVAGSTLTVSGAIQTAGTAATAGAIGGITYVLGGNSDSLNGYSITISDTAGAAGSESATVDTANNTITLSLHDASGAQSSAAQINTALNAALVVAGINDVQFAATGTVTADAGAGSGTMSGGVQDVVRITATDGTLTETVDVLGNATAATFTDTAKFNGLTLALDGNLSNGAGGAAVETVAATVTINKTSSLAAETSNGLVTSEAFVAGGVDITTQTASNAAITTINTALEKVSTERSKLGAAQNRLEHTIKNLDTSAENLQASESRIRDVDMAKEMMNFTKNNILQQAAQAMLAQANQAPQGVLQLLR